MQEWHEECVSCACMCVWKCACVLQLSLMDIFLSPYRAEIYRYCSSLCLPPQHVRLPDSAYGWGPWPYVRWQQRPYPVPGPPWHQQGPTYRKIIPMLCLTSPHLWPFIWVVKLGWKPSPFTSALTTAAPRAKCTVLLPQQQQFWLAHVVFVRVHFFWCTVIKTL